MNVATTNSDRPAAPPPSLLTRLRTTPLRDVLRGRLSGRLDFRRMLCESNLPAAITQAIGAVVRRTRLWKLEKADLARELITHFQDGLESGAAEQELVAAFGDVRQAARLMRRAKIRARPAAWKAWSFSIRALGVLFGVLLAIYAVQAVRMLSAERVLKLNVLEIVNRDAEELPESERAWPRYRAAALATTRPPEGVDLAAVHPGHEEWAAAAAYVQENGAAVAQYRAAAMLARIGVVFEARPDWELELRHAADPETRVAERRASEPEPSDNPTAFEIRLPAARVLREACSLLRVDALAAAEAGDADRVMVDLEAMLGIVDHGAQMPFLVCDLVSLSVLARTTETTGRLLTTHSGLFSDEQLVDLTHRLAGVRGGQLGVRFESERLCFEDVLQRLYSDDGAGDGILSAEGAATWVTLSSESPSVAFREIAAPVLSLVLAGRAEMEAQYQSILNGVVAESREPLWMREESAADRALERLAADPWMSWRFLPIVVFTPSLSQASAHGWIAMQRRDATLTALALELYRREHGEWPETLAELTPRLMPTVPVDQYDGQPLKYRLIDGQPILYSVGADRKDDGGRVDSGPAGLRRATYWASPDAVEAARADPTWKAPTQANKVADGDFVLWPPPEVP